MKPFLTSYSQFSLLSPLRSRIKNSFCQEPYYLLKTGLLSFALFTTWRGNRFTCQASRSASTANFPSKDFYPTQQVAWLLNLQTKFVAKQDSHAKREGRPFYPKSFLLSESRNNPKNITAKNEFSVLHVRKRVPLGTHVPSNILPPARAKQDGQQIRKEEIRAKRATLGTGLCDARASNPSLPAAVPARLSKSFSFQRTGGRVLERSLLPEKFINLLMANGEKDKARRCLTQALFSITTHCQKHNLRNNSPLEIFTDSFFKQQSTESKPSTADNSLKRGSYDGKGTVQQKTGTNDFLPLSPKGKSNTSLCMQIHKGTKRNANPGKSSNVLRDVGLVLLETRLDNLSNGRYSGTKKSKLYPSLKEGQGLLSMGKGNSTFRLNHIERVEKRLLSKQNGSFSLFVKQKGKLVGGEKQTGKFKVPLSLPFCGKSFETTFPVFLPRAKQNNPSLSLIRLSLKERFLISEKGFASLGLHKKVQQSYLCSALLHLVVPACLSTSKGNEKIYQTLPTSWLCCVKQLAIKRTKYRTYTTTRPWDQQQIHFLPFLPYSALFNWREKGLNPLFGFAKQSQRFLLELCKAIPNRSVKGTERIRQNKIFGSFPLLSCFYSARTPSSPFSCVLIPSIIMKAGKENNLFSMAKKSSSYKDEYLQQDTKLQTKGLDKFVADPKEVSDRLVLLNGLLINSLIAWHVVLVLGANVFANVVSKSVGTVTEGKHLGLPTLINLGLRGKGHKQPPQNDSHSNTKDKKTFHCFTQGIPPVAEKVLSGGKDTKSVHTKVLLKGIQRVQPTLEVRRVRKGRNTFQVPSVVKQKRGEKVGIKWIIDSAKSKKRKGNKLFSESLANQLVQSFDRLGEARSKRNELLKLAESNRPFLRFRWW